MEHIPTILASGAFSALISGAIIWITKTWMSERLKESIRHEYDLKFQEYKSKLDLETEKQIIHFKNDLEKNMIIQNMGNKSLEEINKASIPKILSSVEALWSGVIALKTIIPPAANVIDVSTIENYRAMKGHRDYEVLRGQAITENIKEVMDKLKYIESQRVYLGDYIWALYHSLFTIIVRYYATIHFELDDEKVIKWYEDSVVKAFIKSVLTDDEYKNFESKPFGKFEFIRYTIEEKILYSLRKFISAEKMTEDSIKQAKIIEKNIEELNVHMKSNKSLEINEAHRSLFRL